MSHRGEQPGSNTIRRAHMMHRVAFCCASLALTVAGGVAAERIWQRGTWAEVRTTRPRIVLGLQPSPNGPGAPHAPTTTFVRIYVIETDALRFELTDVAPASRRTVEAIVGEPVTFAVDRKTLYVRGPNGLEHRLRITKRLPKSRPE